MPSSATPMSSDRRDSIRGYSARVFQRRGEQAASAFSRAGDEGGGGKRVTGKVEPYGAHLAKFQNMVVQRQKMGLSITIPLENFPKRNDDGELSVDLSRTFKMKICIRFVSDDGGERCFICGKDRSDHRGRRGLVKSRLRSIVESEEEDEDDDAAEFEEVDTDAYGRISVGDDSTITRRYLRLSDESDPLALYNVLTQEWTILPTSAPVSIVINFLGGDIDNVENEKFWTKLAMDLSGLWAKAGATVLSRGIDSGFARILARTWAETEKRDGVTGRLVGLCPWSVIRNKEFLVNHGMNKTQKYHRQLGASQPPDLITNSKSFDLSPHHACYLMVDSGYEALTPAMAGAARLQDRLCQCLHKQGHLVVTIVLEAHLESWERIRKGCKHSDVCVFRSNQDEGEQGAADGMRILTYAFEKISKRPLSENTENRILDDIANAMVSEKGRDDEQNYYDALLEILEHNDKIIVHQFSQGSSPPLAKNILSKLLARKKDPLGMLRSAVSWNQPDMMRIVLAENTFRHDEIDDLAVGLFLGQNQEALQVFLETGVLNLTRFLTPHKLEELYRLSHQDPSSDMEEMMLHFVFGFESLSGKKGEKDKLLSLEMVHDLLAALLPDHGCVDDCANTKHCRNSSTKVADGEKADGHCHESTGEYKDPSFELFIWASLCNRLDLLEMFHKRSRSPVVLAEMAAILFEKLAEFRATKGTVGAKHFRHLHEEYVEKTNKMLTHAMSEDPDRTNALLQLPLDRFNGRNMMHLALSSNLVDVIANDQCFSLMDLQWRRGFTKLTVWRALICIASFCCLLFVTPLVQFSKELTGVDSNPFRRFQVFFVSPVVKFALHLISVVLFCVLYSATALFSYRWEYTWIEIATYIWVLSIAISEMIEFFDNPIPKLSGMSSLARRYSCIRLVENGLRMLWAKFDVHRRDFWNLLDMALFVLMVFIVIFRQFEETFFVARVLFAFSSAAIWTKLFRFYQAHPNMGPKLKALADMVRQVLVALLLITVFVCAYGVAVQSLIDPYRPNTLNHIVNGFTNAFSIAFFQVFGELQLDEMAPNEVPFCEADQDSFYDYCQPSNNLERFDVYHKFIYIFLGFYLLFTAILLLNMFIAVFTNIYEANSDNSMKLWQWERYKLLDEFDRRPILPPPLALIEQLLLAPLWKLWKCCCNCGRKNNVLDRYKSDLEDELSRFERICMAKLLEENETM